MSDKKELSKIKKALRESKFRKKIKISKQIQESEGKFSRIIIVSSKHIPGFLVSCSFFFLFCEEEYVFFLSFES